MARFKALLCKIIGHTDDPDPEAWGPWEQTDNDDIGPKYTRERRCTRCAFLEATQTVRNHRPLNVIDLSRPSKEGDRG